MNPLNFLSICILMGIFSMQIHAYCVYNKVSRSEGGPETTFWMRQEPVHAGPNWLSRFSSKALKSGEKACCPYTNSDCVRSRDKDEILALASRRKTGVVTFRTTSITMPASGWIEFSGDESPENEKVEVFYANGSRFDFDLVHNERAGLW